MLFYHYHCKKSLFIWLFSKACFWIRIWKYLVNYGILWSIFMILVPNNDHIPECHSSLAANINAHNINIGTLSEQNHLIHSPTIYFHKNWRITEDVSEENHTIFFSTPFCKKKTNPKSAGGSFKAALRWFHLKLKAFATFPHPSILIKLSYVKLFFHKLDSKLEPRNCCLQNFVSFNKYSVHKKILTQSWPSVVNKTLPKQFLHENAIKR